jgi:DNA replication protein DnaC
MTSYRCMACKDLGYLQYPDAVFVGSPRVKDQLLYCSYCSSGVERATLARRSGLEPREQQARLVDWQTPVLPRNLQKQRQRAKELIERAVRERAGLYTFWGDFGAGKSLALQIVLNELRAVGVMGCYATMVAILDHLREMYARHEPTDGYWQRLLCSHVLAIDEVTRFHDTGWARERMFELVDMRYRRRETHLTLFATNDDPTRGLPTEEALGYLYSRMREGVLVELRGDVRPAVGARG